MLAGTAVCVVRIGSTILREQLAQLVADARRMSQTPAAPDGQGILRHLVDALPCAAFVANNEGRYVVANRIASDLTGYSNRELRRLSVWDLTPASAERDAEILWRAFIQQREQSGQYVLVMKDGHSVRTSYVARAHLLPGLHVSLLGHESLEVLPDSARMATGRNRKRSTRTRGR